MACLWITRDRLIDVFQFDIKSEIVEAKRYMYIILFKRLIPGISCVTVLVIGCLHLNFYCERVTYHHVGRATDQRQADRPKEIGQMCR